MADFKSSVKRRFLALPDIAPTGGSGELRDLSPGYWFGPLHPISPVTPSDYRPRQYGYTPGANIIWQPKGDSGIGYDILRSLADSWDLLRLVIETRKDQLGKLAWDVRVKEEAGESKADHKQRSAEDPQIKLIKEFLNCPDGMHTWSQWLRLWIEDVLVLDGVSLYLERDKQNKVASVHPLDPATISRLITEQGFTPPPPQVAYQQVVYGVVAADLTQDDLLFVMRNERTHRRYGYSPVEQILMTISIGLSRQEFQLQYYSSGNMPEALCFLPSDMPIDKVKEVQDWFDSVLSGDLAKRRRLTFLPGYGGSQSRAFRPNVVFPKQVLLKDEMDDWLARIVAYAFSVSPQNLMKQMNRASAQQGQENAEEEGLEPMKAFITDVVNVLIQKKLGMEDYEFTFEARAEVDALKQAQIDQALVGRIQTINEIREARGLDPRDEPEADMLGEFTATGFVPITGAPTSEAPPPPPQLAPGQPKQLGGGADAQEEATGAPGGSQETKAGQEKGKPDVPSGPHGRNGKGKLTGAAVGKRGSRLRRRAAPVLTREARAAEGRLKGVLAKAFRKAELAVRVESAKLLKAASDEEQQAELLQNILDQLDDIWRDLPADVQAELRAAADSAIGEQLVHVDVSDTGMIASVNEAAQNWARDRGAELVGMKYNAAGELIENPDARWAITETTRDDLREAIAGAFGPPAAGEAGGLEGLIARILDLGTFSEARAGMIARTEITRAQAEANMELWEQSGMVQSVQWLTSEDPDVCEICQGYADDGPFDLADAPMPVVDSHPNCILAGTEVLSGGRVAAATVRRYEGEVVGLRVEGMDELTVTPNHPILTDRGWVAAGELKQGTNLVYCRVPRPTARIAPDHQDMPASVEDVARALLEAGGMAALREPGAAEDFHGDGVADGEVDVVWAAGFLRGEWDVAEQTGELAFPPGAVAAALLDAEGAAAQLVEAGAGAAAGGLRREDQPGAAARTEALHAEAVALADAPEPEAEFAPAVGEGAHIHRDGAGEVLAGLTGQVTLVKLSGLVRRNFAGHVYNLTTEFGWYAANGIITHNCRCVLATAELSEDLAQAMAAVPVFAGHRLRGIEKYSDDEPRDSSGKWTTGGSGNEGGRPGARAEAEYYHGTSVAASKRILAEGLKPPGKEGTYYQTVYASPDRGVALVYARSRAGGFSDPEARVALVVVDPAKSGLAGQEWEPKSYVTGGRVPPEAIKRVEIYRAGDIKDKPLEQVKPLRVIRKAAGEDAEMYLVVLFGADAEKIAKYADDQPRAADGKWTSGGAGDGGGKIGLSEEDLPRDANVPSVDFGEQDIQDSSKHVTSESILADYASRSRGAVRVYQAYVPMEDIPSERLVEEEDAEENPEDAGSYDWSEYSHRNTFPPVKLEVDAKGQVHILDGNHRLRFWGEAGFTHAPAWVIDYRGTKGDRFAGKVAKYADDEARDERGRWTKGSSGASEHRASRALESSAMLYAQTMINGRKVSRASQEYIAGKLNTSGLKEQPDLPTTFSNPDSPDYETAAVRLVNTVRAAPETEKTLFRGVGFAKPYEELENVKVGDTITLDRISSFSEAENQAAYYAEGEANYELRIIGPSKTLATDKLTGMGHLEHITFGKFEVVDTEGSKIVKLPPEYKGSARFRRIIVMKQKEIF